MAIQVSVGVFAAIQNRIGKILVVLERGKDQWSLPGGGVDKEDVGSFLQKRESGEVFRNLADEAIFESALLRELEEELGLPSEKVTLFPRWARAFFSGKIMDLAILIPGRLQAGVCLTPRSEIESYQWISDSTDVLLLGPRMRRMVDWAQDVQFLIPW